MGWRFHGENTAKLSEAILAEDQAASATATTVQRARHAGCAAARGGRAIVRHACAGHVSVVSSVGRHRTQDLGRQRCRAVAARHGAVRLCALAGCSSSRGLDSPRGGGGSEGWGSSSGRSARSRQKDGEDSARQSGNRKRGSMRICKHSGRSEGAIQRLHTAPRGTGAVALQPIARGMSPRWSKRRPHACRDMPPQSAGNCVK
eukprot:362139-Chlamydomonas_euryale.AAC.7